MTIDHLHLIVNHVPILGVIFSGVLLAVALVFRNKFTEKVSLGFIVFFAAATLVAYVTGDKAGESVSGKPGFSTDIMHTHEIFAKLDLAGMFFLGVGSLLALYFYWKAGKLPRYLMAALLALLVVNAGLMAWTAYLGGQIRRPELALGLLGLLA